MEWQHNETKRPAVMPSLKPIIDSSIEIKSWEDIPSPEFWSKVNMPEFIVKSGREAIDSFIVAFFKKRPKVYYLTIFASGFPNGEVPD